MIRKNWFNVNVLAPELGHQENLMAKQLLELWTQGNWLDFPNFYLNFPVM